MVKMEILGVAEERVKRTLDILGDRVQTLMNAYNGQEYTVEVHELGPVHALATFYVHEVATGKQRAYDTKCDGLDIAGLRWNCDCPEAVYGAARGYRLGVACKHVLLLHALKSNRAAKQVALLLDLLYRHDTKKEEHGNG